MNDQKIPTAENLSKESKQKVVSEPVAKKQVFLSRRNIKSDALYLLGALLFAIALIVIFFIQKQGGAIIVEDDGTEIFRKKFMLVVKEETMDFSSRNGFQLSLLMDPKGVEMLTSSCPDKICVHRGKISREGESIICLPARITIRIEGSIGEEDQLDAKT